MIWYTAEAGIVKSKEFEHYGLCRTTVVVYYIGDEPDSIPTELVKELYAYEALPTCMNYDFAKERVLDAFPKSILPCSLAWDVYAVPSSRRYVEHQMKFHSENYWCWSTRVA